MEQGVSIIIITMNRANELKKTVELLEKQKSVCPYEILIIDQASKDETQEWFCKLERPFKYVRLDKNYGVSGGRNRGAALSKYEYMVFLDDDAHFVDSYAIDKIYKLMRDSESNMFAFQILNRDKGLYNWPYNSKLKEKKDTTFECGTFIGCGHAIKKTFFDNVNGYSDVLFFWGEESELVMKSIGYDGRAVEFAGNIVVIHRVEGDGRKTYDARRFYYQVRNRMYLCNELVPVMAFGYKAYFVLGYFVKAMRNKWLKEFMQGMADSKDMPIQYNKRLTIRQFSQYVRILKKG